MLLNSQYELFKRIAAASLTDNVEIIFAILHNCIIAPGTGCARKALLSTSLFPPWAVSFRHQIVSSRLVLFCHVSSDPIFFGTKICEAAFAMKIRLSFASVAVSHIAWPPCDVQALSGSSGIQPVFRESKLTLLLKEALSGNSRTVQNWDSCQRLQALSPDAEEPFRCEALHTMPRYYVCVCTRK